MPAANTDSFDWSPCNEFTIKSATFNCHGPSSALDLLLLDLWVGNCPVLITTGYPHPKNTLPHLPSIPLHQHFRESKSTERSNIEPHSFICLHCACMHTRKCKSSCVHKRSSTIEGLLSLLFKYAVISRNYHFNSVAFCDDRPRYLPFSPKLSFHSWSCLQKSCSAAYAGIICAFYYKIISNQL